MTITPLAVAAVPAGIAAVKLAQHVRQQQPFRQLLGGADAPEANVEELTTQSEASQFLELVQHRLAAAGLRTSIRFELSSDEAGNLKVDNHPQQQQIEQVLNNDPDIVAAFGRLAAESQLAQAARRHEQFAERYAKDPIGAALTSDLPTSRSSSFKIVINGDEIEID
mgnify:CR=1 FL=1